MPTKSAIAPGLPGRFPLREALFQEQGSYGIVVADGDGNITDWNPAAERIYGYTKAEVLGKSASMFHRSDEHPGLAAEIQRCMEHEGYWAGDIHIRRKDGTKGITDTVIFSFVDEKGQRAKIGINRDVTENRQIRESLRVTAERLRMVTDNMPVSAISS